MNKAKLIEKAKKLAKEILYKSAEFDDQEERRIGLLAWELASKMKTDYYYADLKYDYEQIVKLGEKLNEMWETPID